ncbi:cobalt-precorrin-6A reductase [Nocardioides limicola]|uniref:cobalt-precorrin-6A reductase n=1 Tax=Nocardioides limicola TaxID=2803368 RepID=UPI00193B6E60|nr:cobalt-precorrin-6A reductase [Nocardioides sp. DJM-14]
MARVLILGGTAEARALAGVLISAGHNVTSSLAGRVTDPLLPPGAVRVGGFGGAGGLAAHLAEVGYDALVDATHPYAATITANAVTAAAMTGTHHVVLRRPAWSDRPGWTRVADHAAAAAVAAGRVFLTIGRQEVAAYANSPAWFLIRAIEPPDPPLPEHHELLLARGPFTLDDERTLLRDHEITMLVTKDSGSPATEAKLTAAEELGVTVVVVDRPPLPDGIAHVRDVDGVLDWLG